MGAWDILAAALVLGAVFVNGWTDAPNAIASAVGTRAISFRKAVWLAAVCNLAGAALISAANVSVAQTMLSVADFGASGQIAARAICAVMAAVVLFAACAWYFGLPTSESHALIAALAGASVAVGGTAPSRDAWIKVILGLVLSLAAGYFFGFVLAKALRKPLSFVSPRGLDRFQIAGCAATAMMHGAQDGQKFAAVLIAVFFAGKTGEGLRGAGYTWVFMLCAVIMAAGTAVGGKRIVVSVGIKMVPLQKYQGVCADLGGSLCLLLASFTGIPVSTTHTKTSAILGAGIAGGKKGGRRADTSVVRAMLLAWGFTFPVCGAIGYLLTSLFLLPSAGI
ncbi:MAG: inorganic phosphate transporter [Oscillospiraceae bacterium]|nr:inorganic phosphate transporter [Oscillospiraceae bacterium]